VFLISLTSACDWLKLVGEASASITSEGDLSGQGGQGLLDDADALACLRFSGLESSASLSLSFATVLS